MIRIALDGNFDAAVSSDLAELQDKLGENGFAVTNSTIIVPGIKVELITGLAIASLTVASISALINVINFWKSQRPTSYHISFETSEGSATLGTESSAALTDALEKGRVTGIKVEKI